MDEQQQASMQQEPVSKLPLYLWTAAIAIVVVVGLLVWGLGIVGANADYICTKVISEEGDCTNGSWGSWAEVSRSTSNGVTTVVQQRTYTGTRTRSTTIEYLSGRTTCAAGYTQENNGTWNASWSGVHGGTVSTGSSACQIAQTKTSSGSDVTIANTVVNTGEVTVQTKQISTIKDVLDADGSAAGGRRGVHDVAATIKALPALVHTGDPTNVTWQATGVESCTVTGTNKDAWVGLTGSEPSSAITQQTTYTLTCKQFDSDEDIIATARVGVIPTFNEN